MHVYMTKHDLRAWCTGDWGADTRESEGLSTNLSLRHWNEAHQSCQKEAHAEECKGEDSNGEHNNGSTRIAQCTRATEVLVVVTRIRPQVASTHVGSHRSTYACRATFAIFQNETSTKRLNQWPAWNLISTVL